MKKTVSALLSLLLGGSLLVSFAGCAPKEQGDKLDSAPNGNELVGNYDPVADDGTVSGIDRSDPGTWFDGNKEVLPTREQCGEITVGMRLNEVIGKLGKPQRDIGYGAWLFQFDVADGSVFTVTFVLDTSADPSVPTYDELIVDTVTFDREVPDVYFPQQIVLSELYPWMGELKAGDIVRVRYEHAFLGVAPYYNLRNISYSTDPTDIANAYLLFSSPLHAISESEGQIDGGGYVRYDFITAKETYSVTISNGTVWIGGQYYRFDGDLFEFSAPEVDCHAFVTYIPDDPYEIFTYAEESEKVCDGQGLGEFEFQIYDGLLENAPRYILKSAGGVNLLILSADKFLIEGEENTVIYQITGEKDFSELFA